MKVIQSGERLTYLSCGLSLTVSALAFIAWGSGLRWQFDHLSIYLVFPLLGLLAFSLIWSMYMAAFASRKTGQKVNRNYFFYLSLIVFILIFLHPALLSLQLNRDGYGLPPGSYLYHYIDPALRWVLILATIAWLIFLFYELRFKLRNHSWWRYVEYLADTAFIGLFFHGLLVGHQISSGWYRYIWFFYGITLAIALFDLYKRKIKHLN